MRTTVEINNLIELTQNYLNNKTNQYEGELKSYSGKAKKNEPEESLSKLRQNRLRQAITHNISLKHHCKIQVPNRDLHSILSQVFHHLLQQTPCYLLPKK